MCGGGWQEVKHHKCGLWCATWHSAWPPAIPTTYKWSAIYSLITNGAMHGACVLILLSATLRISCSTKPLTRFYSLCRCVLQEVDQAKYLGVNITKEPQWSGHFTLTTGKANSSLAFLRRNPKNCPQKLKEMAYIFLVRSVLEYSSSIWDPYHGKDSSSIELIQRCAVRFVKSDYRTTSSVTGVLNGLGWKDLTHCRRDLSLALLHKIVYNPIGDSSA